MKPALRDEVSLNGTWDQGGAVPQYQGVVDFDQQTFQRQVSVPATWSGKIIKIEFGAVNFIADVFLNDRHVAHHVGGWNPFAVDVTKRVQPGSDFTLKVDVKGPRHPPIVDANGAFQWPVGGWSKRGGICDDVWLRAYGTVHIEDAFIQTSFRKKILTVDYAVTNTDTQVRTVHIEADVVAAATGETEKSFTGPTVTLEPGETKVVQAVWEWSNPELWWPDSPTLYHLRSHLVADGATLDAETRRFGFREFWTLGNQFRLNGVRVNLFGDYQVFGDGWYTSPELYTPEVWPETVDKIKSQNIRILRWHHNPVPQYVLDVTDEKGLLICDESANYARKYLVESDQAAYLKNCKTWIGPWIKADRNHPCIYLWNATNEMTYKGLGGFDPTDLKGLGDLIRSCDPTRPVGYDGDAHAGLQKWPPVEDVLIDYHYPEGYNKEPVGSIYGWAHLVRPDKPTGTGECLHTKSPLPEVQYAVARNTWWLGIWLRGLRYTNWTNVKPACYWFAHEDDFAGVRAANMRNAYAPVALFDKEYDDLGIAPYVTGLTPGGTLPAVNAGATLHRTLVLYNDEFRDTAVQVEVLVTSGGETRARGTKPFDVPLGEHIDVPCSFQVPFVGGEEMELVLRTFKGGVQKFEEARRFAVQGAGSQGAASEIVTLGDARQAGSA
jgi:hypothetical protein